MVGGKSKLLLQNGKVGVADLGPFLFMAVKPQLGEELFVSLVRNTRRDRNFVQHALGRISGVEENIDTNRLDTCSVGSFLSNSPSTLVVPILEKRNGRQVAEQRRRTTRGCRSLAFCRCA